ncbi:MAG: hypothetical protein HY347_06440 [candidate division NC10 bacterium]|nr:hypothetical protein [candidate division NC10 bacterium]
MLFVHLFALPIRPLLFNLWSRVPVIRLPFAFGYPLPEGAQRAFAPGGQLGRGRILTDQDGRPVIEVVGNNLYVLFDLLAQQEELRGLLLRHTLDLGLDAMIEALLKLSPHGQERVKMILERLKKETEAEELKLKLERQSRARQQYLVECRERVEEEIQFLERELELIEATLEEYSRRITTETRRLGEHRRRLNALKGQEKESSYLLEFDRLARLPDVKEVKVQDGLVSVFTEMIHADYGKKRFCLGAFQIDIHFNGDLRIKNLTDPLGAYDHPHIYRARPCLGNIREGIAKLIGEFQMVTAAMVLIDFLKSVNPSDWRIPILYWPEASGAPDDRR